MRTHTKPHDGHSPVGVLTELAVEGTASLVEAQRTLLDLAQRENDIILNGLKERIGGFLPAAAMTDLVHRSLDTLIEMQQELLTTTSKQTLQWLEAEKAGKSDRAAHLVDFAREGFETFTRAQKKFLEVLSQEAAKATHGTREHEGKGTKKTELSALAREAGCAFLEAQKRLLDVMGQQMNVNLDATTRALEFVSPSKLPFMGNLTGEGVRSLLDAEENLIGSLIKTPKKTVRGKHGRRRPVRQHEAVPA